MYIQPHKVPFDPSNRRHRLDFAGFLKYNNWKTGCRYILEEPYQDIPSMIKDKLLKFYMESLTREVDDHIRKSEIQAQKESGKESGSKKVVAFPNQSVQGAVANV